MARVRTLAMVMVLASCTTLGAEPMGTVDISYHTGYRLIEVPRAGQEPLPVALWYPTRTGPGRVSYPLPVRPMTGEATEDAPPAAGPFPLVIYSHGAGGCGIMGATYAEALAEAGFVVAAPDHGDEFQVARSDGSLPADAQRVREWVRWATARSRARYDGRPSLKFAHRPAELSATITFLLEQSADPDSDLHGLIDADRIGAMGVSFGAWTTQAVAGFHGLFRDERIKAAVPIAGNVLPGPGSFANIKIPVMMIFGEKETVALLDRTTPPKTDGMLREYETANPPKFLVGIRGARHLDFGPTGVLGGRPRGDSTSSAEVRRNDPVAATVNRYSIAFFRRYLKDDLSAEAVLTAPTRETFLFRADPGTRATE